MGEVYRAVDTKLGRDVALKVLPAEMAANPERVERFRREAQALAALDHPGIVTVHSVEESHGVHFLTMQLVEGRPLDRIVPEGGLTAPQILEVATGLVEALAAAHDRGIVHRDLKPSNVMITADGRVKVLDFGLAKFSCADGYSSTEADLPTGGLTREGVILGTVPYMSPEQVSGLQVDQRTDIFSLGVLLYEMATGRRPFQGRSSAELASAILRDPPPPLLRSDLPAGLCRLLFRCLEKAPADRFANAREVVEVLKELRSGPSLLTETMSQVRSTEPEPAVSTGSRRREEGFWVAVLPFRHRGTDPAVEALADGLTEEIVTGLSRFSYLRVISRGSTSRYAGGTADAREVGAQLGARYVLDCGLRQAGSRLRVAVQVVDAVTGTHLWAETYNRVYEPEEVFALQDDLVPRIVSTVADHFGVLARAISEAVRGKPVAELTPYEALMRGFGYHFRVSEDEHAVARDVLEKAVERAPSNPDCWAMLSWVYSHEFGHGFNPRPGSLDRALDAARRAVDLAPANHIAQQALAVALFFRKDRTGCLAAAERAMALNPLDGSNEAFFLVAFTGDWERGCSLIRRAMDLNPHHPRWFELILGLNEYRLGRYPEALDEFRRANLGAGIWTSPLLAAAHAQLGDRAAAEAALSALSAPDGDVAGAARKLFEKWFEQGLVEHLMDGLSKAGLEISDDPPPAATSPRSSGVAIAVLPFADLSPAKNQDYLCEGMAEEIMNALVGVSGIRVASRTSAFRARQEGHDLAGIARLLSVGHVLEGSVRAAGTRLRVTAQLTDTATGYHLWSERFDREAADIFAVQDEIASGVVDAVRARLAPGPQAIQARPHARNLEAYRSYLLGRHLRYAKEDYAGAGHAFREAVRLDPTHAPSWVGIADCLAIASGYAGLIPVPEACAEARRALATATELQGESADGLHAEAFVALIERRWEDLEITVRRGVSIYPTHVPSLGLSGMTLSLQQRPDEAEPFFDRAREADPIASFPYMLTGLGLLSVGMPRDALRYLEQALVFEPDDGSALNCSVLANVALGRFDEGIAAAERAVVLTRRWAYFVGLLGWALAAAGRRNEARAHLDELRARPAGALPLVPEGWLLGALGEIDAGFEVFARAEQAYQGWLLHTGLPSFDPFRNDPRFTALCSKLGVPAAAAGDRP